MTIRAVPDDTTGELVLLGAPLGNPEDASPRLRRLLGEADVVAAEDTRRLHRLAADLGVTVTATIVSYFEGNERERTPRLLAELESGATVAVITDGGMPSVSDPGFRLVRAAVDAGVPVTAVPGPTAVTTALALSGLPTDRFCFEGFLPRKTSERDRLLAELAEEPRTMVFFESPHRIGQSLTALAERLGADRPAALCRELTKTYEEVRRGGLADLAEGVRTDPPRGEITLVVTGHTAARGEAAPADLAAAVAELIDSGVDRKTAMSTTARRFGVPRRAVFDALLTERESD
ncbi:16S rRNA (cytidine1402-2'-O)-methyltransferase [Stackebrandtia albiflava]|uniref:Ribosomal RNA small subunit methyltransferase I n=1 Tax=Stackebrandtia albiflava TaxID=406432 RepID=A0A562VH72_9ACTN|nr:16S rRNA (cytidine1402-2'-O)-methyltransferase [Stackebrandtia albiflava]